MGTPRVQAGAYQHIMKAWERWYWKVTVRMHRYQRLSQEVGKLLELQNTACLNLGFGMFRLWHAANHGLASPKEGAFSDGTCLDCTSCSGCTCSVHHQANYLLWPIGANPKLSAPQDEAHGRIRPGIHPPKEGWKIRLISMKTARDSDEVAVTRKPCISVRRTPGVLEIRQQGLQGKTSHLKSSSD